MKLARWRQELVQGGGKAIIKGGRLQINSQFVAWCWRGGSWCECCDYFYITKQHIHHNQLQSIVDFLQQFARKMSMEWGFLQQPLLQYSGSSNKEQHLITRHLAICTNSIWRHVPARKTLWRQLPVCLSLVGSVPSKESCKESWIDNGSPPNWSQHVASGI